MWTEAGPKVGWFTRTRLCPCCKKIALVLDGVPQHFADYLRKHNDLLERHDCHKEEDYALLVEWSKKILCPACFAVEEPALKREAARLRAKATLNWETEESEFRRLVEDAVKHAKWQHEHSVSAYYTRRPRLHDLKELYGEFFPDIDFNYPILKPLRAVLSDAMSPGTVDSWQVPPQTAAAIAAHQIKKKGLKRRPRRR